MQEKDLIRQLKAMREIKPRKEWVSLTKSQILGQEEKSSSFSFPVFNWKWALAPTMAALLVVGFLAFSRVSPQDQPIIIVEDPEPTEDPVQIVQKQETEEITDMIKKTNDLVAALSQLTETIKSTPGLAEETAEDVKKVEEEIAKMGQLLAVLVQEREKEAEQDLEKQVEYLIADFETRSLDEEQGELLEEAKADYEARDFDRALEKLLRI